MVEWRSGSAGALQAQGRGFKSLLDHHESKEPLRWGSFCVVPSPGIGIRSKRVVVRASNLNRAAVRESAIAELDLKTHIVPPCKNPLVALVLLAHIVPAVQKFAAGARTSRPYCATVQENPVFMARYGRKVRPFGMIRRTDM